MLLGCLVGRGGVGRGGDMVCTSGILGEEERRQIKKIVCMHV